MTDNCHTYVRRGDTDRHSADEAARANRSGSDYSVKFDYSIETAARDALEATIGRAFHARVLKEIARVSQAYPELSLVLTENTVSIPCSTLIGFAMSIQTHRGRYRVTLDEWSDEFARVDEAMALVEDALRGQIRIRIEMGLGGRYCFAERRLPSGSWIAMPRHDETVDVTSVPISLNTSSPRSIDAFYLGRSA